MSGVKLTLRLNRQLLWRRARRRQCAAVPLRWQAFTGSFFPDLRSGHGDKSWVVLPDHVARVDDLRGLSELRAQPARRIGGTGEHSVAAIGCFILAAFLLVTGDGDAGLFRPGCATPKRRAVASLLLAP